jgi:RNA polymerase sigma-70 factor (ECF subfamily)
MAGGPEDAQFARYVQGGDRAALASVFAAAAPELRALAARVAGRGPAAEDLVQATWLAAIEGAGRFEPGRPVRPWLAGILVRLGALARRRGRRRLAPDRLPAADAPDPEQSAAARELAAHVDVALARVPETACAGSSCARSRASTAVT